MNRGVWVGTLALGLGGLVSGLHGQQPAWRPVQRGLPAGAKVRAMSREAPRASLGRPMTGAEGVPGTPRLFPVTYRGEAHPPGYGQGGVEPIATVAPAGAVIAVSGPPSLPMALPPAVTQPEEPTSGDQFASDRLPRTPQAVQMTYLPPPPQIDQAPAPLPLAPMQPDPKIANWQNTFPVTPPVPQAAEMFEMVSMVEAPPLWYARAEYLLWWTKNDQAPIPLATSGGAFGARTRPSGALGQPDTVVLADGSFDRGVFHGGRFTLGYTFDECNQRSIEVSGFFLGPQSADFLATAANAPVLTRPFFNVNEGRQFVEFVSLPGNSAGSLRIESPSELWGIDVNLIKKWCCGCDYRIDLLVGFRHLNLRENLTIVEDIQFASGLADPFDGTRVLVQDSFATRNQFSGGQIGVQGAWQHGRFTFDGRVKLGLGVTRQTVTIDGFQVFPPGTPNVDTRPGGLLALNSNIGTYSRDRFSVVPEVGVGVGYDLAENVRVSLGYNFLFWSNVVRPGDQIDPNLDITRIPNFVIPPGTQPLATPRPAVLFKDSDFWAQGLTFGLEFRY